MKSTIHVSIGNSRSKTIEKNRKTIFLTIFKKTLLVLSYLRFTYPEEQFSHFSSQRFPRIINFAKHLPKDFPPVLWE